MIFSNLNYNCSHILGRRNLQEHVKKVFCYQKLFWPFTVWINCSSDLKIFANSRPSALNFEMFSPSLEYFFSRYVRTILVTKYHFCSVERWPSKTELLFNNNISGGIAARWWRGGGGGRLAQATIGDGMQKLLLQKFSVEKFSHSSGCFCLRQRSSFDDALLIVPIFTGRFFRSHRWRQW